MVSARMALQTALLWGDLCFKQGVVERIFLPPSFLTFAFSSLIEGATDWGNNLAFAIRNRITEVIILWDSEGMRVGEGCWGDDYYISLLQYCWCYLQLSCKNYLVVINEQSAEIKGRVSFRYVVLNICDDVSAILISQFSCVWGKKIPK